MVFVGYIGSGKSFIINLMMCFYEFECGDILIDGKLIKFYEIIELCKKIGLVL